MLKRARAQWEGLAARQHLKMLTPIASILEAEYARWDAVRPKTTTSLAARALEEQQRTLAEAARPYVRVLDLANDAARSGLANLTRASAAHEQMLRALAEVRTDRVPRSELVPWMATPPSRPKVHQNITLGSKLNSLEQRFFVEWVESLDSSLTPCSCNPKDITVSEEESGARLEASCSCGVVQLWKVPKRIVELRRGPRPVQEG